MKTIAVVEDNVDNRLLLREILSDDYRIVEYESGPEALEGIRSERPDLVLLDIQLPEMDGPEVLRRLRAEPALTGLPVVAVTSHAMRGHADYYLSLGFDHYISKPILIEPSDVSKLLEAIERLLNRE
jgi:CheY-like chemotaxis protein